MKLLVFIFAFAILPRISQSQIVYFEDFGSGCTTGTLATSIGWTVTNTGANEANANIWYVSANEQGVGPGNCGAGCGGTQNRTLHLGAEASMGGDLGAAYFESSALFCAFLGLCSITDRRVESPTINCTGISSIPLSFNYIENGEGTNDDCTVWYSANNGSTWALLDNPPKTALCVGGQGMWTTRNLVLPASANNNPTVKIGFRWVNNGNGVGTDPSFAVDNIQVGTPLALGVEMLDMTIQCNNGIKTVNWITQNELNADHFNIYGSVDTKDWALIKSVDAINQSGVNEYNVTDYRTSNNMVFYYYIEQVDKDGQVDSYEVLSINDCNEPEELRIFPNPFIGDELTILSAKNNIDEVLIYSNDGRQVGVYSNKERTKFLSISPKLLPGMYFVQVYFDKQMQSLPFIVK